MHHSKHLARLLLAGVLLCSASLSAAPLKLLGLDDMTCATWNAHKGDDEWREPYVQWVRGFLTGHNYANQSGQVAEVSRGTVAMYVDRHCAERASSTVANAAMRMSDQYSGRNAPITR